MGSMWSGGGWGQGENVVRVEDGVRWKDGVKDEDSVIVGWCQGEDEVRGEMVCGVRMG